jgi:alkanesulfonate monooxygenase SsuD/methylene tetrahydromethanopterin reductase-like flavin-dependent oxidoreductase (luciferase family)
MLTDPQRLKQPMEMVNPPGYMSPGSLRGVLMTERKPFSALSYEELLAEGYAVVGSPASVADRLKAMYDELGGYGQLIGLFAIGPSTHEQILRSAELFAAEVMPVLRPLGVTADAPTA